MKKFFLIFLYIFLFIFLFINSCGIPQVLPHLNIPIADINSYSNVEQLDNKSIIYTCTNKENYFKGYQFFYVDTNNFFNKGYFCYFDEQQQKLITVDTIPTESELALFKTKTNFQFTFYLNKNRLIGTHITDSIRDTYSLLQEDKISDISELYASGKSITIYFVPVGVDELGKFYVYTPAFTTSSNKVIFSFK